MIVYPKKSVIKKAISALKKAKDHVKAIVMDQDGTVKGGPDPLYKKANVAELLQKIALSHKYPAIITASGASALKSYDELCGFYSQQLDTPPAFIGIGNGAALYRFDAQGRKEIYNHGLTLDEINQILSVWEKLYQDLGIREVDLQPKGIETFKNFMQTDWIGYIPTDYLEIFKGYNGRCFTEPIKVTVVFPIWDAVRQRQLVKKMQEALDKQIGENKLVAKRGDDTFLHISHAFEVDPKLYALRKIMEDLHLSGNQVVAFGDMPNDNDKGLLVDSGLPFTFTNDSKYQSEDPEKPPYPLPDSDMSPVKSVHDAVNFLLS